MKSFTDLFVRRPVLAIVVNVMIIIAGLQAWRSLSVRQYPRSENASVIVATVYVGASADVVRGFITTAIERSIASADGIDYVESKSLLGLSLVTARLKLNYDPTKALADITAKVNQVRNELPAEAEVPSISVESADSEFAALYLSFSSDTLSQSEITDYLVRAVQPRLAALAGVQRGEIFGARTFAMRVWLKPAQMAALNLSPAQVRAALAANNYLAAVGSTKGAFVQVNLTANTDLHTVEEFKQLVIRQENDTIVRLQDVADVELGAEDYDTGSAFQRADRGVHGNVLAAKRQHHRRGQARPRRAGGNQERSAQGSRSQHRIRHLRIHQQRHPRSGGHAHRYADHRRDRHLPLPRFVPVGAGAGCRHSGVFDRRHLSDAGVRVHTQPAHAARHRAVGRSGRGRRHRRG